MRNPDDDPRPQRRRKERVRVGRTRLGRAVFAARWFAPDEIIGEIDGEIIADEDYGSRYCMDLEDGRCLEPGAPFRYMNHSCVPNCSFNWHDIENASGAGVNRRVFVIAQERIWPGDELTIDYRWPPHLAIPCRCGEQCCRGWVVAIEDLPALLTQRAGE